MKMDVYIYIYVFFFWSFALITALADRGDGGEISFKKLWNEAKVKDREEKEKIHLYSVNMNQK
mgnify:CR=1 FL=1